MHPETIPVLERLAAASLKNCLHRLSRVAAGTWEVLGTRSFAGSAAEALEQHDFKSSSAAVQLNMRGGLEITALMMFRLEDTECILKCFTGHSFPKGPRTTPAEEVMLTELGNIVLNAVTNDLLNHLKKSSIPSIPELIEGDKASITAGLARNMDVKKTFRIVTVGLAAACGTSSAKSEIVMLLPEKP